MPSIPANELKTRGVTAIEQALAENTEAIALAATVIFWLWVLTLGWQKAAFARIQFWVLSSNIGHMSQFDLDWADLGQKNRKICLMLKSVLLRIVVGHWRRYLHVTTCADVRNSN